MLQTGFPEWELLRYSLTNIILYSFCMSGLINLTAMFTFYLKAAAINPLKSKPIPFGCFWTELACARHYSK